jgi:hypothetical protein
MNWSKLLYVLIIVLIYVPMVFLGVNAFYPDFAGPEPVIAYSSCYEKFPRLAEDATVGDTAEQAAEREECEKEQQTARQEYEAQRNAYEGKKYTFIAVFNLLVLLLALFVSFGVNSITAGLFFGSLATTFFATIRYLEAESKVGFVVLVITFFVMLWFIAKKRESLWEPSKKRR